MRPLHFSKLSSIANSLIFLILAPGFIAGVVPWWISHWRMQSAVLGLWPLRLAGHILIAFGVAALFDSFLRFASRGLGTPAPPIPARHLVLTGLYRYVRNPMYLAVVSVIAGQALAFGSLNLLAYAGLIWFLCNLLVLNYEEPTLKASFGTDYREFCQHVPRWIPRMTPWNKPSSQNKNAAPG